jgi:argonaute-like protein implicated in RNA metabolism and viral defense
MLNITTSYEHSSSFTKILRANSTYGFRNETISQMAVMANIFNDANTLIRNPISSLNSKNQWGEIEDICVLVIEIWCIEAKTEQCDCQVGED